MTVPIVPDVPSADPQPVDPQPADLQQVVDSAPAACETEMTPGAMLDIVHSLIGQVPCGFEYLEYAMAGGIFLILASFIANFLLNFSKILGAK